ncbi:MAG: two-component system response regulator [Nitratiruptor sp.]|nr:two-component system response regulator [Nitratiruptor sp.]NPA83638.1 response regulator transcription factor [Campylobacterota bacterium]
MKGKILLLEDDLALSETIREYLEDAGFVVESVYTGDEALERVYEHNYDLLLLDVMVPGIDGFELLRQIRERTDTPAIFITSLDSVENLERGFKSGCDDYIRKPFALKELLLRIETLLKREFGKRERVVIDDRRYFDLESQSLYVDGEAVPLNQKERSLLKLFLKHPNEPLSHERIHDALWEYGERPSDMALRTYIKKLRKYLGKERIESIKRYGYKFIQ